jgi:hypothetical protein
MQVVILQSHLPHQRAPHAAEKPNTGTGKGHVFTVLRQGIPVVCFSAN